MEKTSRQEAVSRAIKIATNALKEDRERRELESLKKAFEILKQRKTDAVIETFFQGTGSTIFAEAGIIVLYKNPSDYPDKFVARIFNSDNPTQYIALADTYEEIMGKMPANTVLLERTEKDDPVIIGAFVAQELLDLLNQEE